MFDSSLRKTIQAVPGAAIANNGSLYRSDCIYTLSVCCEQAFQRVNLGTMQRLSRLPGSARFSQAAAACELASARHMLVEHCMPSSYWPAQSLVPERTSAALTASPSASWQNIFGLAALPAVQSSSIPCWNEYTPALPAQAQAAADLAQIQQLSNADGPTLGVAA